MTLVRYRLSPAVIALLILTAILPAKATALQLAVHAIRANSSVVANQTDSLPVSALGSSSETDDTATVQKPLMSPSGEKGSGISGKVFARFVLPEDWISLAALPGAQVASASIQGGPTPGTETVFTMRSFGQKVRAWLNGYRLGYWPQEKGRL